VDYNPQNPQARSGRRPSGECYNPAFDLVAF
jgi:hypothetical protein